MSRETWVRPVNAAAGTPYGQAGPMWSSGRHTGLDFPAPAGTPVSACAAGRVVYAGNTGGAYGIQVKISHRPGLETWYCHLSSLAVTTRSTVAAGDVIGAVGETGNTTGPHLHLEVRRDGMHTDPAPYLAGAGDVGSPTFPGATTPVVDAEPAGLVEDIVGDVRGLALVGLFVAGGFALLMIGAARAAAPTIDAVKEKAADTVKQGAEVAAMAYTGGASKVATTAATAAKTGK